VSLRFECERPELGAVVKRIADDDRLSPTVHLLQEFVVDILVCEHSTSSYACLTSSRKDSSYDTHCSVVDICIVEDNIRALSTEFECRSDETGSRIGRAHV